MNEPTRKTIEIDITLPPMKKYVADRLIREFQKLVGRTVILDRATGEVIGERATDKSVDAIRTKRRWWPFK